MSARPRPALVVPDETSWTVWGADPAAWGLMPASAPEQARALLVPEVVPAALVEPLAAELARVPRRPLVIAQRGPAVVTGSHVGDVVADAAGGGEGGGPSGGREGRARHDEVSGHGHDAADGHGHVAADGHGHDAMAIVGEPSADGLVMEPIELELGPLSWILPGGLVASLRLDGDVVASCEVRATLVADGGNPSEAVDPLAPTAWAVAVAVAEEWARGTSAPGVPGWLRIAAVELERAVSHLAWLRSLGRLMGWPELVGRSQRALAPVLDARRDPRLERAADVGLTPGQRDPASGGRPDTVERDPAVAERDPAAVERDPATAERGTAAAQRRPATTERRLADAASRVAALADLLGGRRFAMRARGRGRGEGGRPLAGPNGRSAGSGRDARSDDPLYRSLGFEPVVRDSGDVEARVLVRAHESAAAVALATRALARASADRDGGLASDPGDVSGGPAFATPAGAAVEGPRGPVLASAARPGVRPLVVAPGGDAAAAAAGAAVEGLEWSAALLTLVSFDLSAWRVPG